MDELPDLESLFADIQEQEAATAPPEPPTRVRPGKDAQRIYRDLARRAHPDLSTDPAEQRRRSAFIARVNEAYAYGDAKALAQLAEEWSTDPEAAPAVDSPDRLAWLRQRLEWLGGKIAEVAAEQVRLENTAMGELLALSPRTRTGCWRSSPSNCSPRPPPSRPSWSGCSPRPPGSPWTTAPRTRPRRPRRCSPRSPPSTPPPSPPTPSCSTSASRTSGTLLPRGRCAAHPDR